MPSLVQSASNTATTGTTVTVTLGSNTTAGNCLIAYIGAAQATTNPVVSGITLGGAAGNWAVAKAENTNNGSSDCEIWVDWNCAGGQTSVVVTFTAGTGGFQGNCVTVEEWSGIVNTGNPVDVTNGQTTTTFGTSWSSLASGTLSQASELVVGAVSQLDGSAATITGPGAPWTNITQLNASTNCGLLAGHQVVSATTSQTYNGTFSTSVSFSAVIVTLKAAAPSVQGKVTAQQSRGRQKAAPGQARTARARPAPATVTQARARGQASARRGSARTAAASPAPAVPTRARVRAVPNPARPGRVTVVRSTGAGVVIRPAVVPPPQGRDDKPHLKKLLLLLE